MSVFLMNIWYTVVCNGFWIGAVFLVVLMTDLNNKDFFDVTGHRKWGLFLTFDPGRSTGPQSGFGVCVCVWVKMCVYVHDYNFASEPHPKGRQHNYDFSKYDNSYAVFKDALF